VNVHETDGRAHRGAWNVSLCLQHGKKAGIGEVLCTPSSVFQGLPYRRLRHFEGTRNFAPTYRWILSPHRFGALEVKNLSGSAADAALGSGGVSSSKFYDWRGRYGRVNEHNGWVPRDFWLEDWEKQAIINFHLKNPLEGYWGLTLLCQVKRKRALQGCNQAEG
jgi:hypothetical protein